MKYSDKLIEFAMIDFKQKDFNISHQNYVDGVFVSVILLHLVLYLIYISICHMNTFISLQVIETFVLKVKQYLSRGIS